MTREEIIKEAAADHRDMVCCGFYDPIADAQQKSFVCGAKWADEHPNPDTVNKQKFIERACEYLESVLKHDLGYYGAADFANTFRKAMEE